MNALDELERLAKAATPGPWHKFNDIGLWSLRSPQRSLAIDFNEPDIDYIAALSPERVLQLIAVVRAADYFRTFAEHYTRSPGCDSCAATARFDDARHALDGA